MTDALQTVQYMLSELKMSALEEFEAGVQTGHSNAGSANWIK